MENDMYKNLIDGIKDGSIIPYLGPDVLTGSVNLETNEPIPADSDSLICAMNNGQPMAPRLMYEFPRAAMHVELKRGRTAVNKFLTKLYLENKWTRSPFHDWLAKIKPAYVIDINRDIQLQESYSETPHNLMKGISRIAGTDYRFKIFHYDGTTYTEIDHENADTTLPLLFKPMGSPAPNEEYIASDADYVDYITELMGGFGLPPFLKESRKEKQYLFLGFRMTRDSERMVMSDITYAASEKKGWALIKEPTPKEVRFCARQNIEIIDADIFDLMGIPNPVSMDEEVEAAQLVGC